MDPNHPYRPPASEVGGPSSGLSGEGAGSITPGIIEALRQTRPWVLFIAVMILIACGLMLLIGVVTMMAGSFLATEASPVGGLAIGLVYLVMAALYLYPAIRLLKYSAAIKRIGDADSAHEVEQALIQQQAFWRFIGIVTLVLIGFYILMFGVLIIAGIAGMAAA